MNYDVVLKAIGEATDLRKLMDSIEAQIASRIAQIGSNRKEIGRLKTLEGVVEKQEADRKELVDQLGKHQAELNKRLAKLEDANVKLPFDESTGAKPIVNT